MTFIEILLLAVSLSFDTLAVSMGGSVTLGRIDIRRLLGVAFVFGLMQMLLLDAGWLLGHSVISYIYKYASYIGMALLLYIGGTMIAGVFRKEGESKVDLSDLKHLLLAAVATSVDAAAVGVSLAMGELSGGKIALSSATVLVVTMIAAVLGITGGSFFGRKFGKWAQLAGGLVLILIGVKMVVS